MGVCFCHQPLYLLAPPTSPGPEQSAGNNLSPPATSGCPTPALQSSVPGKFQSVHPHAVLLLSCLPAFGGWRPPLTPSQDARLPLASLLPLH